MFMFIYLEDTFIRTDVQYKGTTLKAKSTWLKCTMYMLMRGNHFFTTSTISKAVQKTLSENYSAPFKTLWLN